MNILISTTTNWNPGDFFIAKGVKNILKHFFPDANYIHYDRNPNNMVAYPFNQNMKEGLLGNFMNNPIDWSMISLVVLAGSPEWLHEPLAPIYEGLVEHPEIPLWAIGVGYSEPEFMKPLTTSEIDVLSRESTLIITRQKELEDRLVDWLDRIDIYSLPCPALFCFENFPKKEIQTYFGCHSIAEMKSGLRFSSDPYDLLNLIGSVKEVISDRLHAVIAGISSGAKTQLMNLSFRTTEAMKLFEDVINAEPETILKFKAKIFSDYLNIIDQYAKTFSH